jgi:hypothetical protein
MTQGEKMIWAATYALELREPRPQDRREQAAFMAALRATNAVMQLRRVHEQIPDATQRSQDINILSNEMLNEMLGIVVEPPLR